MPVETISKPVAVPRASSIGEATFLMHCTSYGLYPVREHTFCQRKWRFDFAWPDQKIAVEIEGGTRSMGRHQRHYGFEADCYKYNRAAMLGWRVLRFTTGMVASGEAIDCVRNALAPQTSTERAGHAG